MLLLAALALLGARVLTGSVPRAAGVPLGAAAFVAYLSFFATVPPLVLFGRTVGMAISDLSARVGRRRRHARVGEPRGAGAERSRRRRRADLVLLWTRRDPERPTPADRLSGRPLALD